MLLITDQFWSKAKYRVDTLGHREEDDPDRYERLVRAAYDEERQKGYLLLKNSGVGRFIVMKSIGMQPKKRFEVKKTPSKSTTKSGKPEVGGWAQGRRPDYTAPVNGQIMAVGRDGIVIRDDRGRRHHIRHEHITKHEAALSEKEWPKAAKALAEAGEKIDPVSRFRKPEPKARPDKKLKRRVLSLKKRDKLLDVKRALKEGSVEELQALVDHYSKKLKKSEPWTCRCDGCSEMIDNGEGEDGMCGNCADAEYDGRLHWHDPRAAARSEPEVIPDRLPEDIRNMKSMRVWRV